jgi:peptidoglycan hydrolase-like protein with peptidoglycan-binding domain
MPTLKQNSSGPDVQALQQKLKDLGFDPNGVDGPLWSGDQGRGHGFSAKQGFAG